MRIVIQNSARVWGGNEKWALLLAEGLAARGHDIVASCRAGSVVERRFRERGIRTTSSRPGGYADVPRGLAFGRFVRRERADVVLLTSWAGLPWGSWAARRAGARVIVRLGIVRVPDRARHARPFRRVDALIVNATAIRDAWVRDVSWFPPGSVHVVMNAVPDPGIDRGDAARRLRRELDVPDDVLVVGGAGHATHRKGFDILIDAVARVDGICAVVAGDGPELERLRARAERSGIAGRVHFLGHRDDVPGLLAGCDVFVLSSRNEGMANVMLEAMVTGTPVVAADISGVREVLDARADGPPAGWVVPPDDATSLARALVEVTALIRGGAVEVTRRTVEARRRVEQEMGVDRMIAHVESVLAGSAAAE